MDLHEQIKQYYLKNLIHLSPDKTFHFATRIAAWQGEPAAYKLLTQSRDLIFPPDLPLAETIKKIVEAVPEGKRNAHELRAPYFAKYPLLYGTHSALFRVRHLAAVYGVFAKQELFAVVPQEQLDKLADELLYDHEALRVLSTFAVNYLYLYRRILLGEQLDPTLFLTIAGGYDRANKQDIQLLIYLYTHCIIGESNFYTRTVDPRSMNVFTIMLQELETVISQQFESINLDNKLEFLVCCRICDYQTQLYERIMQECVASISEEGTFLVDRLNTNGQADRSSFEKSEHRNVLFIMSGSAYKPHSTLV